MADKGKAFEYAVVMSFHNYIKTKGGNVNINEDGNFRNVKNKFSELETNDQTNLMKAADTAILEVIKLESNLQNMTGEFTISVAPDYYGANGDVRDVILTKDDWEIGVSCKHNHQALKHQRLSNSIDFGKEWAGYPVSQTYWQNVNPIFKMLNSHKANRVKWRELHSYGVSKENDVYIPLLNSFLDEFNRLDAQYPDLATKFMEYLAGRKDFYKFVMDENNREVTIYCYNLHGDLGSGSFVPLPTHFIDKSWKINKDGKQSNNTLIIKMNNDWVVGLRLHSAASLVETSLKFDTQPIEIPNTLQTLKRTY